MSIGFIGLGNLGTAISKRLKDLGEDVIIYNRTTSKIKNLGFKIAANPKELLKECDIVFLCLFDSNAVKNIFKMENGLLSSSLEGKTIIDLSTNHYEEVISFHNIINENSGKYLEAPIFGSVAPALQGLVTIVASGKEDTFTEVKPLLEKIGKEIFYLKEKGSASKMKLINNLCLGSFMTTLAECTALGEACDIEKSKLLEILGVGGGQSLVLKAKTKKLIDEDFSPHFSNDAIAKDLNLVQELATSLKRPLYSAQAPKDLFSKMQTKGDGKEDFSSIYKLFK